MTRVLRLLVFAPLVLLALSACGDSEPEAAACEYRSSSSGGVDEAEKPPADPIAKDQLTITTNRGAITAELDAENAPCAVSSFVSLADQGFFDDSTCHRLVPGFVLQCGDPSGTGGGGPGYEFDDELTGDETYPAGTLAMANSGPDTNGSQFFVVLQDSDLDPAYTVFGTVDAAGLKVAQDIAADGVGADGQSPAKDVVIESVK